jgi:hypothetical protein
LIAHDERQITTGHENDKHRYTRERWKMNTICAANVAAFFRFFIAYTHRTQTSIHGLEALVPRHSTHTARLGCFLTMPPDLHARRARRGEATHPNNVATAWTGSIATLRLQAVLQQGYYR